jgi:hypothetical protein
MLVVSVPLASAVLAEGVAETEKRKAPKRLPAVTVTSPVGQIQANPKAAESSLDVTACAAETKSSVIGKTVMSNAVVDTTESSKTEPSKTASVDNNLPARWLRSSTSTASAEVARRLISQATREYNIGASLSAENSAWEAIRWAAEAVDLADRENGISARSDSATGALEKLQISRQAIREARDFSGAYGSVDAEAITRMAKSHVTDVLDSQPTQGLSATDAADRYLEDARVHLAPIAAQSVEAAQAMDLLAAIYLNRADSRTLPSSTALCLRRAALQGQPSNASLASRLGMHLADVGLMEEARWALEHSMSLEADPETAEALVKVLRRSGQGDDAAHLIASMQNHPTVISIALNNSMQPQDSRIKIPQITQLSPADFAALSKPVMQSSSPTNQPVNASLVGAKTNVSALPAGHEATAEAVSGNSIAGEDAAEKKPGAMRRLMSSFKRIW